MMMLNKNFTVELTNACSSSSAPRWGSRLTFAVEREKLYESQPTLDFNQVVCCKGVTLILEMKQPGTASVLQTAPWHNIVESACLYENGVRVQWIVGGKHAIGRNWAMCFGALQDNFLLGEYGLTNKVAIPLPFEMGADNDNGNRIEFTQSGTIYYFSIELSDWNSMSSWAQGSDSSIASIKLQLQCFIGHMPSRRIVYSQGTELLPMLPAINNIVHVVVAMPVKGGQATASAAAKIRFIYLTVQQETAPGVITTYKGNLAAMLTFKTPTGQHEIPMMCNKETWQAALDGHSNDYAATRLSLLPASVALFDQHSSALILAEGEGRITIQFFAPLLLAKDNAKIYCTSTIVYDQLVVGTPTVAAAAAAAPTAVTVSLDSHELRIKELERKVKMLMWV
jgi:hypothetical protein